MRVYCSGPRSPGCGAHTQKVNVDHGKNFPVWGLLGTNCTTVAPSATCGRTGHRVHRPVQGQGSRDLPEVVQSEELDHPQDLKEPDEFAVDDGRPERADSLWGEHGCRPLCQAVDLSQRQDAQDVAQESDAADIVPLDRLDVIDKDQVPTARLLIEGRLGAEDHVAEEDAVCDDILPAEPQVPAVVAQAVPEAGGTEGEDNGDVYHCEPDQHVPVLLTGRGGASAGTEIKFRSESG